ncbi:MAG: PilZ domain-containing protein [Desulfobacterales bacterium]|nr:PilZ domain-containing protein [Desulfobacterales bacterium]
MNSNPEKRDNTRFDYQAPIVLEDAKFGILQGARMFNYSDFGLYFETDHFLAPGTDIYIGIPDSPYTPDPDVYERYHAEIKWRKPLKESSFYYGYGVRFLGRDPLDRPIERGIESRRYPRKSCSLYIKYAVQNQIYPGEVKNISLGGVFFKTNENDVLDIGQQFRLAIPNRKKSNVIKRHARVIWSNRNGFGVEFQRNAGKVSSNR